MYIHNLHNVNRIYELIDTRYPNPLFVLSKLDPEEAAPGFLFYPLTNAIAPCSLPPL